MIFKVISYILTVSFATIFPPFTAVPIELSAPAVFGVWPALLFTISGNVLGSIAVFFISKKYGWKLVYKLFDDKKVDRAKEIIHKYSFWHITFLRMAFSSLWDVLSYAIGLTKLTLGKFILSSVISTLPSTSLIILFGNSIDISFVSTAWISIGIFIIAIYFLISRLIKKKKQGRNALILHGTQGNSKENWFPWLKEELEDRGYEVWLPDLPGADHPNLDTYNKFLLSNSDWRFGKGSVIIGHSSGAVATLALLNKLPNNTKIDTCILVSVFEKDSAGGAWEPNKSLFEHKFDIENVRSKAKKFVLLISDDDKYCPVGYVKKLGRELGGKVVITQGDGHFSVSSGGEKYKKLPIILKYLK
jgi:uncharacterized protein